MNFETLIFKIKNPGLSVPGSYIKKVITTKGKQLLNVKQIYFVPKKATGADFRGRIAKQSKGSNFIRNGYYFLVNF